LDTSADYSKTIFPTESLFNWGPKLTAPELALKAKLE